MVVPCGRINRPDKIANECNEYRECIPPKALIALSRMLKKPIGGSDFY